MNTMISKTITMGLLTASLFVGSILTIGAQELAPMPPTQPMATPSMPEMPALPPMPSTHFRKEISINRSEKDFKDLKSKEVSVVVNAGRSGDIYIDNTSRAIEIKAWNEPKVKVVTTIYYDGDASKLSDGEWFEKLNINVKTLGSSVRIKSGTVSSGGSYEVMGNTFNWSSGPASGVAIFNGEGETIGTKKNITRLVTIYLPKDNKVSIESKYADVTISDNLNKLIVDLTNGNLETQDINTFTLRSKYANVNTGNLQTAEVEFINGHFTTKEVDELDVDTKYSTVDIASVNKLHFVSTNDEYDIESAGSVRGQKNYGNLRISKLLKSIEMDGTNADVKVRNIAATVSVIQFYNKYADMRLPLRSLKSYTINYSGPYSTVYGNFEKKPFKGKTIKNPSLDEALEEKITKAITQSLNGEETTKEDKFSATVGDGKGAQVDIRCQNCTVDFK